MSREDFAGQYDLELDVGKWLNGVADFQTALTQDKNIDALTDMSQRAEDLGFYGGSNQMHILKTHGAFNNAENIIEGFIGTLTANPITAFKGKNASAGAGGITTLYSGLTKGRNLIDDIKSFSVRSYNNFIHGIEQFYNDMESELNKGQNVTTYH